MVSSSSSSYTFSNHNRPSSSCWKVKTFVFLFAPFERTVLVLCTDHTIIRSYNSTTSSPPLCLINLPFLWYFHNCFKIILLLLHFSVWYFVRVRALLMYASIAYSTPTVCVCVYRSPFTHHISTLQMHNHKNVQKWIYILVQFKYIYIIYKFENWRLWEPRFEKKMTMSVDNDEEIQNHQVKNVFFFFFVDLKKKI